MSKDDLKKIIDVRDGVVHVGYLTEQNTRQCLSSFLRFRDALYNELNVPPWERWETHVEFVQSLISDTLTAVERDVAEKLAAAKHRYEDLVAKIPPTEQASVFAARQAANVIALFGEEERTDQVYCPACGHENAVAAGKTEIDFEADHEPGDFPGEVITSAYAVRVLYPERMICGVCDFVLTTRDEVVTAGLDRSWAMDETVDPDEYIDEREYDYY